MSSSYFVDFTGYIDERKRPEGFPKQVHVKDVYDSIESIIHLQAVVNTRFIDLIKAAGLVVLKDEDEPIETGHITFDKRIFVPWHMITHMTLDVKHIPNQAGPEDLLIPLTTEPDKKPKEVVN
jgi:hypothetical protein